MFHLLGFSKTMTAGSTDEDCTGTQDGYATLNASSHYLLPETLAIYAAYILGATLTKAKLQSPKLRFPWLPYICPLEVAATPQDDPALAYFPDRGYELPATDELSLLTSNAAGAGERHYGLVWAGDGVKNLPPGQIIPMRATAGITNGTGAWVAGALTLSDGLPPGRYAVVGMDAIGTGLIAARLMFPSGGKKPGCIGRATQSLNPHPIFRKGRLGVWGEFEHTAVPSLETFGAGSGTTQEVYLDLIKIR